MAARPTTPTPSTRTLAGGTWRTTGGEQARGERGGAREGRAQGGGERDAANRPPHGGKAQSGGPHLAVNKELLGPRRVEERTSPRSGGTDGTDGTAGPSPGPQGSNIPP